LIHTKDTQPNKRGGEGGGSRQAAKESNFIRGRHLIEWGHTCSKEIVKGVCQSHRGLAIYIKKYLKAKRKNYGNSNIFHHAKIYPILQKLL
jgi:hypothetical protein